jgi:L-ribulokinase
MEQTIKNCLADAGASVRNNIKAISVDTTGSTPVAIDASGTPLALLPGLEENPNAMFVLWKDHTAVKEALEINAHAAKFGINYLKLVGGIYSSEWFWSKLLHVLRVDGQVRKACFSWVEHCDWISFMLTGGKDALQIKRSVCAAGHKALWAKEFGGLPPEAFFSSLDPLLAGFRSRLFEDTYTSDQAAGNLCTEWADRFGLSTDVIVGIGGIDAHMGAVGGQIEPYFLTKIIGTSTCDMVVVPKEAIGNTVVSGICGQVDGSIIPGMIGMEAGQSAFGDTYAWFKKVLSWPLQASLGQSKLISASLANELIKEANGRMLEDLSRQASLLSPETSTELSVDWLNGRRTPDANQLLKAAVTGLSLGTDAPQIFRALVESTCFGARKISERFQQEGVPIKGVIGVGGITQKSEFVMQMLADVMNIPIRVNRSEQTCALGAAMFAATAAGIYPEVSYAMEAMGAGFSQTYTPDARKAEVYNKRYFQYEQLAACLEQNNL